MNSVTIRRESYVANGARLPLVERVEPLTRRPRQGPPAQNMDMQMENRLATVHTSVDDRPVAAVQPQCRSDSWYHQHHVSTQRCIFGSQFIQRNHGLLWDEQHMDGGLRVHITKGQAKIVFVNDAGRDFLVDDLLKDGHFNPL